MKDPRYGLKLGRAGVILRTAPKDTPQYIRASAWMWFMRYR